jgi:hypothetical protein
MYTELHAAEPTRYGGQLAGVLQNLGAFHDALGSPRSVTYTSEALRLRKENAGEDLREQAFVATLTNNLANQLLHVGERRKARKTVLEGIEQLRLLANLVPKDALAPLGLGLSIYAGMLASEGRSSEAMRQRTTAWRNSVRRAGSILSTISLRSLSGSCKASSSLTP